MTPFLKKEIRLLLPAFLFALAIAVASVFFHGENGGWLNGVGYFLDCIFFPAVVIMLALNSFGTEVGTQMFAMMLAQPVERQRVWQTKIVLLATFLILVAVIWAICAFARTIFVVNSFTAEDLQIGIASVVLFGLVVFSGALWTVLLLRQVAAAFWFTLIVPGALLALVAIFCSGSSDEFILAMATVVLGGYSLAGFFFARWLFFRAQDLQWTGGTIVLPEWRRLGRSRVAAADAPRFRRPIAALWRKEIQLQQSQFVIAFALLVLHLGVIAIRNLFDFQHSPDLKALLDGFWVLWMVMPFLVGCAAVAEERKIGTHEGQLCLPVNRQAQFIVKFLVTVGLSLFLGAFMPALLEVTKVLHNVDTLPKLKDLLELLVPLSVPVLTGAISFYVSSMARNTLQTLAPAVLGVVVAWPSIIIVTLEMNSLYGHLWRGPLGAFILMPILALVLLLLAYSNFQCVLTGWTVVIRNLLTILCAAALGVILTTAVYHRIWEKITPFEGPHGPPRLSLSQRPSLQASWAGVMVSLPDGKVWASPVVVPPFAVTHNLSVSLADGDYSPDTNWLALSQDLWLTAGIKNDGTLWVSRKPTAGVISGDKKSAMKRGNLNDLVQYGSETDWRSAMPWGPTVLLVKKNGTLWCLGSHEEPKSHQWPPFDSLSPKRLGTDSDWSDVTKCGYGFCFYKTNGSGWVMGNWTTNHQAYVQVESNLVLHAAPPLDNHRMHEVAMISHGMPFWVGIRNDGTFRIWGHERESPIHRYGYEWFTTDLQIGNCTNWIALASEESGRVITLKSDGTLWLWDFERNQISNWDIEQFDSEVARTVPVQLGSHSDWIAISSDFALAADGSLWYWPTMSARELANFLGLDRNGPENRDWFRGPWLDISRKPQLLGNILSAAN